MITEIIKNDSWTVTFKCNCLEAIRLKVLAIIDKEIHVQKFISQGLSPKDSEEIISLIPWFDKLRLSGTRINYFYTQPNTYMPPHKDSAVMNYGINIPIEINDQLCITNWYANEVILPKYHYFEGFKPNGRSRFPRPVREVTNFKAGAERPEHMEVMQNDQVTLFNVGKFHDWYNFGPMRRITLTLRPKNDDDHSFDWARETLLEIKDNKPEPVRGIQLVY